MSSRLFEGQSRYVNFADVADYITTGAVHVPIFEHEIMDRTRKRGTLLQRVKTKAATGHPTRYIEKKAHDSKHKFINPRQIDHDLDTEIDRVERAAYIRAMVDGITFGLFDHEVHTQQSWFGDLQGQDLAEVVSDMLDAQDRAVWTGNATSLMDDTSIQYCSLLTQITKVGSVATTARLTKAIMDGVAVLMYNKQYKASPTAIYMNPFDKARLDSQEMDATDKIKVYDVEILPGIKINGIMTAAGILPIITDVYCPLGKIAILDENLLERQYITTPTPRLYQLGQEKDLATRYIAILFDTFIVRGGSYGHLSETDNLISSAVSITSTAESTTTASLQS